MKKLNLNKPTPEENFRNWTSTMKWKIEILMEIGFTKDQAIEMLKVYMLSDLENIYEVIGNIG